MEAAIRAVYPSLEVAFDALSEAAKQAGFAISIRYKKPSASHPTRARIDCSCSRKPPPVKDDIVEGGPSVDEVSDDDDPIQTHPSKRRVTASQRTECPFRILASIRDDGLWVANWGLEADSSTHNHALVRPQGIARYRQMTVRVFKAFIMRLAHSGKRPAFISQAVNNEIKDKLLDLTPIEPSPIA